jgi:hypothetical protein
MMARSEELIILRQVLVLTEQEHMGIPLQRLRAEVPELLLAGGDAEVELRAGTDIEDYRVRERLLLVLPANPVNRLNGFFILGLGSSGTVPVVVRRAKALQSDGHISVRLEVKSGPEIEGRWAYSRRPEMRKVSLASFDDPLESIDTLIFHATDFQQAAIKPSVLSAEEGWTQLDFELPVTLLEESRIVDGCERLLEALDARSGDSYLEWPEESLTQEALEEAAAEMERQVLPKGRQFNLTLEVAGHEMTRGKRLQPLVRYPITLVRRDGSRVGATLGCSIS